MQRGAGTSAKCLQITGWGLYRNPKNNQLLSDYRNPRNNQFLSDYRNPKNNQFLSHSRGTGMGMWVDERGRKVSESFSNFKIGQIEGWRILHKYLNREKCCCKPRGSESGILGPEKTSPDLSSR